MSSALLEAIPGDWPQDEQLVQLLYRFADKSRDSWAPALTRQFMAHLGATLPAPQRPGHPWLARLLLPSFAKVADPASAAAFEPAWRAATGSAGDWRTAVDNFFDLVRLRHEMILSFQEPA